MNLREPIPVFIDLARLRDIDDAAFRWTVKHLHLPLDESDPDEDDLATVGNGLRVDIIRYDKYLILRLWNDVIIWDRDARTFVAEKLLSRELSTLPSQNPLREHQTSIETEPLLSFDFDIDLI